MIEIPRKVNYGGLPRSLGKSDKKRLRRRQVIEPTIRHLKADHGMRKTWLKGATGDALHVVTYATGFNLKCRMRAIALYLPLFAVLAWMKNIIQAVKNEQSSRSKPDQARLLIIEN